jgi:Putative beta-barrel porin-2, OmpL-like. bbp2
MLKKVFLTASILLTAFLGFAQLDSALTFSGSVDFYYRYNFSNAKDGSHSNNYTSFTNSQNSFELGMASIKADYSKGKVEGVIDLGFGNRAQEFSYNDMTNNGGATALAFIKQAYVSYSPTEKVKFTAGKWATHVGYELLDPQLNRDYSMSYMFSYGPFSHTGLKVDIAASDHVGLMLGIANPTDYVSAMDASKFVLGQVSTTFDKFSAYLNYVGGSDMDDAINNQVGLTAIGTISDKFSIGYDGTVKWYKEMGYSTQHWWGSALYLNADPCPNFGLTLRGEIYSEKKYYMGPSIFDATLSFDIKPADHILIIPEFRLDTSKDEIFTKKNGDATKSTASFVFATIFSF